MVSHTGPWEKAVLHCLKYAGQETIGLILSGQGECKEFCLPLFHSPCPSVSMLQTAISLLDGIPGLQIEGMYYASNIQAQIIPPLIRLLHHTLCQTAQVSLWRYIGYDSGGCLVFENVSNGTNGGSGVVLDAQRVSLTVDNLKNLVIDGQNIIDIVDYEDFMNHPESEWIRI